MRASAVLLLFSLGMVFHAPLVLASRDAVMDCCAGGTAGACCLLAGSCSLRSCPSSSDDVRLAPMTAFVISPVTSFERPAAAALSRTFEPAAVCPGILLPPDPPPRA